MVETRLKAPNVIDVCQPTGINERDGENHGGATFCSPYNLLPSGKDCSRRFRFECQVTIKQNSEFYSTHSFPVRLNVLSANYTKLDWGHFVKFAVYDQF